MQKTGTAPQPAHRLGVEVPPLHHPEGKHAAKAEEPRVGGPELPPRAVHGYAKHVAAAQLPRVEEFEALREFLPPELAKIAAEYADEPPHTWGQTKPWVRNERVDGVLVRVEDPRAEELRAWLTEKLRHKVLGVRMPRQLFKDANEATARKIEAFLRKFNGVELDLRDMDALGLRYSKQFAKLLKERFQVRAFSVNRSDASFYQRDRAQKFLDQLDPEVLRVTHQDCARFNFDFPSLREVQIDADEWRHNLRQTWGVGRGVHIFMSAHSIAGDCPMKLHIHRAGANTEWPIAEEIDATYAASLPYTGPEIGQEASLELALSDLRRHVPDCGLDPLNHTTVSGSVFDCQGFGSLVAGELRQMAKGQARAFLIAGCARPAALVLNRNEGEGYRVELYYNTVTGRQKVTSTMSHPDQMRGVDLRGWTDGGDGVVSPIMRMVRATSGPPVQPREPELASRAAHVSDDNMASGRYLALAVRYGCETDVTETIDRIAKRGDAHLVRELATALSNPHRTEHAYRNMVVLWQHVAALGTRVLPLLGAQLGGYPSAVSGITSWPYSGLAAEALKALLQAPGLAPAVLRLLCTDLKNMPENYFGKVRDLCKFIMEVEGLGSEQLTMMNDLAKYYVEHGVESSLLAVLHGMHSAGRGNLIRAALVGIPAATLQRMVAEARGQSPDLGKWVVELAPHLPYLAAPGKVESKFAGLESRVQDLLDDPPDPAPAAVPAPRGVWHSFWDWVKHSGTRA